MEEPSCAWTAVEEKKEDKRNRRRKKVRVGTKKSWKERQMKYLGQTKVEGWESHKIRERRGRREGGRAVESRSSRYYILLQYVCLPLSLDLFRLPVVLQKRQQQLTCLILLPHEEENKWMGKLTGQLKTIDHLTCTVPAHKTTDTYRESYVDKKKEEREGRRKVKFRDRSENCLPFFVYFFLLFFSLFLSLITNCMG